MFFNCCFVLKRTCTFLSSACDFIASRSETRGTHTYLLSATLLLFSDTSNLFVAIFLQPTLSHRTLQSHPLGAALDLKYVRGHYAPWWPLQFEFRQYFITLDRSYQNALYILIFTMNAKIIAIAIKKLFSFKNNNLTIRIGLYYF